MNRNDSEEEVKIKTDWIYFNFYCDFRLNRTTETQRMKMIMEKE